MNLAAKTKYKLDVFLLYEKSDDEHEQHLLHIFAATDDEFHLHISVGKKNLSWDKHLF